MRPGATYSASRQEPTVAPDITVAWNERRKSQAYAHFVRAKVRVHDYPGGELAIFHGPRCLLARGRINSRNRHRLPRFRAAGQKKQKRSIYV
jgi:hypothetical protein